MFIEVAQFFLNGNFLDAHLALQFCTINSFQMSEHLVVVILMLSNMAIVTHIINSFSLIQYTKCYRCFDLSNVQSVYRGSFWHCRCSHWVSLLKIWASWFPQSNVLKVFMVLEGAGSSRVVVARYVSSRILSFLNLFYKKIKIQLLAHAETFTILFLTLRTSVRYVSIFFVDWCTQLWRDFWVQEWSLMRWMWVFPVVALKPHIEKAGILVSHLMNSKKLSFFELLLDGFEWSVVLGNEVFRWKLSFSRYILTIPEA